MKWMIYIFMLSVICETDVTQISLFIIKKSASRPIAAVTHVLMIKLNNDLLIGKYHTVIVSMVTQHVG